ncbi:hypothetical protein F4781DRAFT_111972 [Annulohypoxylon bovei var. microspora]|nr:hypothetical protein F4781DRAFT_111972 [Annulohypoxylon bovei var. microspora]
MRRRGRIVGISWQHMACKDVFSSSRAQTALLYFVGCASFWFRASYIWTAVIRSSAYCGMHSSHPWLGYQGRDSKSGFLDRCCKIRVNSHLFLGSAWYDLLLSNLYTSEINPQLFIYTTILFCYPVWIASSYIAICLFIL